MTDTDEKEKINILESN